jgi:hypothetical protein
VGLASDSERERVAASLREHFLRGRLTFDEFSARVALALRARTHSELRRALVELPSPYAATRVVARAVVVLLLTGAWLVFSFLILGLFGLVLLIHGASTLEFVGFLVVWLVPTFLLSRQWRRAFSHPFRRV